MRDRAGAGGAVAVVVPMMGRALLVAVAAVLVVMGYLVVANALSSPSRVAPRPPAAQSPPAWKAAYSRKFPDCVASVLWPDERVPDAVLVRLPGGRVERISREAAAHGALRGSRYEDAHIIGACYPE